MAISRHPAPYSIESAFGGKAERTDIFAHLAGFASGCLFGALFGFLENRLEFLVRHQIALGLAAVTLFAVAWLLALLAHG